MSIIKILENDKIHPGSIGTDIMRKRMGEVLDCVYLRGDEFIIERKNKPMAALISLEKYDALNKFAKEAVINMLGQSSNIKITQDEADLLSNEAKHQVREKR
jgi:prevent-host-death family protein